MPTATVYAWNDTGWRHDGAHARLIAFDLDNTLAVSKQPMKPDMTVRIEALTELMPVAIVTGGGRELVISQVLDVLGPRADLSNLHVMPAGGSSYYRWREGAWRLEYERTLSARDRDAAILSLTQRARELGMWPEHPWGEPIEDRGSQITFSALGQLAPIEAKEAWDPTNEKKNRLARAVAADLPHLEVRPGGASSVDISEKNVDKSFAVRELADILGITVAQIVFVGDRMDPDGNDYPAAKAGTRAVKVTCPNDTVKLCGGIIASLSR